jgi:DNA-binding FrmR family transcriptional regulator
VPVNAEPPIERDLYVLDLCRAAQLGSVMAVEQLIEENPYITAAEILNQLRGAHAATDSLYEELVRALRSVWARTLSP